MRDGEHAHHFNLLAPPHAHAPFRSAAVLGAGTMGAQIAAHLANAGLRVLLLDMPSNGEGARNKIVDGALARTRKMKPNPFFDDEAFGRVETGNFEDDMDRLVDAEWVIEAIVERLDVKRRLFERVESSVGPDAIVSTNTSGLSIADIAEGRSESFRRRFLGTHFFNPPRYLELLELVPSEDTDPHVVERIAQYGRIHLGKGIVVARDTPYFIGNRVGVFSMLQAMRAFTDGSYSIEEIDALTGTLAGRPKSATFRTADVVGLDVLLDVAANLYGAVEGDERREALKPPRLLERLVEAERYGQKSGAGFYKKDGGEIKSVDTDSLEYRSARDLDLPELAEIRGVHSLADRLRALYDAGGRTGTFFRSTTLDLLAYSAHRIPGITSHPADIDRALRWGFGWDLGPFEIWDVLGFERVLEDMKASDVDVPGWIEDKSPGAFYRRRDGGREVYTPGEGRYRDDPQPRDHISLDVIKSVEESTLWASDDAGMLSIGEGVALLEFRSKANTLGRGVMDAVRRAVERVEDDRSLHGLVIANDGTNFSVGANLVELAQAVQEGQYDTVDAYLRSFQETIQRIHYARKPVVVAVHQRVLGGGCEMVMACPQPVATAESYLGLVELGVGLIPAGTGVMRLASMASRRSINGHPSEIQAWLQRFFQSVAMAAVSSSSAEAQHMGYLQPHARIVMHADRRIHVAREEVLRLSIEGYRPPARGSGIKVLGRPARAALEVMVRQYVEGRYITEYDAHLANKLAYILTGGDLTAPQQVDENYLTDLERAVFLELIREKKTQERIEHMLKTKKPLRN